jgi:hypothetical protein
MFKNKTKLNACRQAPRNESPSIPHRWQQQLIKIMFPSTRQQQISLLTILLNVSRV